MPKKCPDCLRLIGDKTRAGIIQQLRKKPQKVSDIEAKFSLTQPTISYHLKVLEKEGILLNKKTRKGNLLFHKQKISL